MRARTVTDVSTGTNLAANAGAAVVIDPNTGGIVAMASWPTFRPSWFVRGLTEGQRFQLFESKLAPMLNRATQITYGPGSTFKPFVALAALKEGLATLGGYYACPAEYVHPDDKSGTVFHNWDGHNSGRSRSRKGSRFPATRSTTNGGATSTSKTRRRTSRSSSGASSNGVLDGRAAWICRRRPRAPCRTGAMSATITPRYPDGWIPGIDILLRDRGRRDEGHAAAGGAGVCGYRQRQALPTAPRLDGRGRRGERGEEDRGACRRIPYSQTELDYIREALRSVTTGRNRVLRLRTVFARCRGEDRNRRATPVPGHVMVRRDRARGTTPVRGGGHRGAGRIRGGDRGADRPQHHEQDLPNALRGPGSRGDERLMDLVAGRVYADERRPIRHIDGALLLVTAILLVLGFFLLYSATNQTLKQDHLDPFLRVNKQMVTAAIGFVDHPRDGHVRLPIPEGLRRLHRCGDDRRAAVGAGSVPRLIGRPAPSGGSRWPDSRSRRRSSPSSV